MTARRNAQTAAAAAAVTAGFGLPLILLTMVREETQNEEEQTVEITTPVVINVNHIRSFNPRRDGHDGLPRVGTRLTFANGGFAVTEPFEEVLALVSGGRGATVNASVDAPRIAAAAASH